VHIAAPYAIPNWIVKRPGFRFKTFVEVHQSVPEAIADRPGIHSWGIKYADRVVGYTAKLDGLVLRPPGRKVRPEGHRGQGKSAKFEKVAAGKVMFHRKDSTIFAKESLTRELLDYSI
jgi:hypothetical protein